jgi:hypothetical protein
MGILFTTQYLNLLLHTTTHKSLEPQRLAFVASAAYRASAGKRIRLTRQHYALALIANNHLLRALRPIDLEWRGV